MSFNSVVFTNRGKVLQAKATAGAELKFTKISMGDGEVTNEDITLLQGLINKVKDIPLSRIEPLNNGTVNIGGTMSNQDVTTGFYFRELGLYALDPDLGEILYCYGNAGVLAEYIPASSGSEILEKRIDLIAIVGDATNVSAVIDNSLVYVTIEEFNNLKQGVEALSQGHQSLEEKVNESVKVSISSSEPVVKKTGDMWLRVL